MDPRTVGIVAVTVLAIVVVAWVANARRAPDSIPPVAAVASAPEVPVDSVGWNSDVVRTVRAVYELADSINEGALVKLFDGARIAAHRAELEPTKAVDFGALGPVEREVFLQGIAQELIRGKGLDSAHFWKPVDGRVTRLDPLEASVRISADRRLDPGSTLLAESRSFDWRLVRADDQANWKVWSWERFITEEERRLAKAKKPRPTKITLEDGTSLYQSELRHLEPYPGTPPEVTAQVEREIATMLDFSLRPPENNLARDELVSIGRPAIPLLLNKFYETRIVDSPEDPSLTRMNMVNDTLKRITGYDSGFTAMPGQTEERRTIALKAWFAWWDRKGENFGAADDRKDLLDEPSAPTEFEKTKGKAGGR